MQCLFSSCFTRWAWNGPKENLHQMGKLSPTAGRLPHCGPLQWSKGWTPAYSSFRGPLGGTPGKWSDQKRSLHLPFCQSFHSYARCYVGNIWHNTGVQKKRFGPNINLIVNTWLAQKDLRFFLNLNTFHVDISFCKV